MASVAPKSEATSSPDQEIVMIDNTSTGTEIVLYHEATETRKEGLPSTVFYTLHKKEVKIDNIITRSKTVGLAALGLVDFGESEDSYLFRVSLPGVKKKQLKCHIQTDGKIVVQGRVIGNRKGINRFAKTFKMISQDVCPTGPFSVSFDIPGHVDPRQVKLKLSNWGTLEVAVMKDIHS